MQSMPPSVVPGIYEIEDRLHRSYIGSSVNIYRRWSAHRRDLDSGTHHSPRLQRAWRQLGADAFTFRVLQIVPDENDLCTVEQYYFDAFGPVFNVSRIAGRPQWSPEKREAARAKVLDRKLGREIAALRGDESAESIPENSIVVARGRRLHVRVAEQAAEAYRGRPLQARDALRRVADQIEQRAPVPFRSERAAAMKSVFVFGLTGLQIALLRNYPGAARIALESAAAELPIAST
jgi:hypothetical protein